MIIVKRLLVSSQAADSEKVGKDDAGWIESEDGQECYSEDAVHAAHNHGTHNSSNSCHHQFSPPPARV